MKEFVNPNLHVVLLHFPIGVFALGIFVELLGLVFYRRSEGVRSAARWMIVLGALSMIPAAFTGMYALADVTRRSIPTERFVADDLVHAPWHETAAATGDRVPWERLDRHAWTTGPAAGLASVLAVIAIGCSNRWRRRLYVPLALGFLAALGIMAWGAWAGGEMVYTDGAAVKLPYHDANGIDKMVSKDAAAVGHPILRPAAATAMVKHETGVPFYVPPLQTHVLLAGVAVAVGLLSIGLTFRAITGVNDYANADVGPARELLDLETPRGRAGPGDRSPGTDAPVIVPASRLWLMTFLLAAGASAAGWWVLAHPGGVGWDVKALWEQVRHPDAIRRFAHVIGGGVIIVLPLVLAGLARWAGRSKLLLGIFSLLLVLAVAGQVWLGILLMFDQPHVDRNGPTPWYRLREPAANPEQPQTPTAEGTTVA